MRLPRSLIRPYESRTEQSQIRRSLLTALGDEFRILANRNLRDSERLRQSQTDLPNGQSRGHLLHEDSAKAAVGSIAAVRANTWARRKNWAANSRTSRARPSSKRGSTRTLIPLREAEGVVAAAHGGLTSIRIDVIDDDCVCTLAGTIARTVDILAKSYRLKTQLASRNRAGLLLLSSVR
jgi:hypothetical protein